MLLRILGLVVLFSVVCAAQASAALEKRVAAAKETLELRKQDLSKIYERLENACGAGRTQLTADVGSRLTSALATARALNGEPKAKLLAEVKRGLAAAAPAGAVGDLAPWLNARLLQMLTEGDVAKNIGRKDDEIAAALLEPLLREGRAFHDSWNEELSRVLPAAETLRMAHNELNAASDALISVKDPSAIFRRGAPAGFARIPAGNYMVLCSAGFAGQGVRKKDRSFVLDHDVFLGINEVTNAEYLGWLLKITEEERQKHQPRDDKGKPLWEPEAGSGIIAVPVGAEGHPVCGISLASALSYAQAQGARLPTEEEWSAAAVGRDKRLFPWGPKFEAGRCNDRERDSAQPALMPVGSAAQGAGPFGHQDLAGNVAEWTMTYESGKVVDPAALAQENVAIRGGSFRNTDRDVSNGWVWLKRAVGDRDLETGFRLLIDPATAK